MLIQFASDLHLEIPKNNRYFQQEKITPFADILILAGDTMCNHSIFRLDIHRNLTYLCAVTFKNNDYGKRESKLSRGI